MAIAFIFFRALLLNVKEGTFALKYIDITGLYFTVTSTTHSSQIHV